MTHSAKQQSMNLQRRKANALKGKTEIVDKILKPIPQDRIHDKVIGILVEQIDPKNPDIDYGPLTKKSFDNYYISLTKNLLDNKFIQPR